MRWAPLALLDCLINCKFDVAGTALCAIFYESVIPKDLAFLLDAYLEFPGPGSARDLLAYAPNLAIVFEGSQPSRLSARIDDKAATTAKALLFGIMETELIEDMWKAYEDCLKSPKNLRLSPREFTQDDVVRLLSKLMCFCVYVTVEAVAGRVVPNDETFLGVFRNRLYLYAEALLCEMCCDCQRQIVMEESVTFAEKINQYLRGKQDPGRSLELSALHVGAAISLEAHSVTSLIAAQYAIHTVELVGVVLDGVFSTPAWL